LPERVAISTRVPFGDVACQRMLPHDATVCASRTSEVNVPRSARSVVSLNTFPGLEVANSSRPPRSCRSVVTCSTLTRLTSAGWYGSPESR
jgi:hypothetical protein